MYGRTRTRCILACATAAVMVIPALAHAQERELKVREAEGLVELHKHKIPDVRFQPLEPHRANFKAMLLEDPNCFGNLQPTPPETLIYELANTKYEELESVGLSPEFDLLHAIVNVKLSYGYGGSLCTAGTREYVRFYLSYDNGSTWEDLGVVSFTAWDISGPKPLEYAVTLKIDPNKRWCLVENLPRVRAILSWNVEPPDDTPDYRPVWGEVKEVTVQIEPSLKMFWMELVKGAEFDLPPEWTKLVAEAPPLPSPPELTPIELHQYYAKPIGEVTVPPKRYLHKQIHKLIVDPQEEPMKVAGAVPKELYAIDIDWGEILKDFSKANTNWEELVGVGLDTNTDTLVAIVKVKLSAGYSGGLCTAGSTEYVAFWADTGAGWEYVGTSSVRVHDLKSMPPEGVYYAVILPWNVAQYRRPCGHGARTARVRGVLSWQSLPSTTDPHALGTYGNREDTLVHITPGVVYPAHPAPYIQTIGGMSVQDISSTTGLANGTAQTAGFAAYDSPFGGLVVISGHIVPSPNISEGATPMKYRISVSDDDGATWETVSNTFYIARDQLLDGVWSAMPKAKQSAPDGWYEYQEDLTDGVGDAMIFPAANTLARWHTGGRNGRWKIRLQARDEHGTIYTSPQNLYIDLDNVAPTVHLAITSGAGDCDTFAPGSLLEGTYSVADEHFGWLTLRVLL
jgi:hypothetical protein